MKKLLMLMFVFLFSISFISCKEKNKEKEELNITKTSYILEEGQEEVISYEVKNLLSDTVVMMKSLDEEVCKVENGKIYALKEGTTKIEVYLSSQEEKIYLEVKVNAKKTEPKEELLVEVLEYTIEVNEECEIKYQTNNLKEGTTVIIESNDLEVVSVNGAIIKGLKSGNVTLKVYLSTNKEHFYSINVKVNEPPKPQISIKNIETTIPLFGKLTIKVDIDNSDITEYVITSSDEEVISIKNNELEGLKCGKSTIRVTLKDNEEIYDEIEFEVILDPMLIFESLKIDEVLVQNVVTHGENPKERNQLVLGSVLRYSFRNPKMIEEIVPITENKFNGKTATPEMLVEAEKMKLVRSGIKHDTLNYIVYHDTGNINPGADAKNHADYMVSNWNKESRARSWHYTVDENVIYHHIPNDEVTWQGDSYDAYARSIGVETCVNYGADLYKVWQNAGKLMASLIIENGLSLSSVKQHYDMSGKNCPQTLRTNNLYSYAVSLISGELLVQSLLKDYKLSFKSLTPEYLDNTGKVFKQPLERTILAYEITIEGKDYKESKVFTSEIAGSSTNTPLPNDEGKIMVARNFDEEVAKLSINPTKNDEEVIENLISQYDSFDSDTQRLIGSIDYLRKIEENLFKLYDINTPILINEVFMLNDSENPSSYRFIELYNTTSNSIDLKGYKVAIKLDKLYEFEIFEGTIPAKGYFLIGLGDLIKDYSSKDIFDCVLPDCVFDLLITDEEVKKGFSISILSSDDKVIDKLGVYENSTDFEEKQFLDLLEGMSISRKHLLDTNNNYRDFKVTKQTPTNSKNETNNGTTQVTINQIKAFKLDYELLKFNIEVTGVNKDAIEAVLEKYENQSAEIKKYLTLENVAKRLKIDIIAIDNHDIKVLYDLMDKIPAKIVNDYKLPEMEGLSFEYSEGEDSSYYDLKTGKLLKVSYDVKYVTIVATYNETKMSFTINFGLAEEGDKLIFNTGAKAPSAGKTSDGFGTYADQDSAVGFGGVAIRISGKIFFIGKNCLINLSTPESGFTLSRKELRPLGGIDFINNVGIVNGKAKEYAGTGALYYNSTNEVLKFDLSDTYGRNNSGAYGYFKVIFGKDISGSYCVSKVLPNSGTNDTTTNVICELNPGEYLWCPHTYETNVNGGTWLINPASSTSGGVLVEGTKMEIIKYKTLA